MTSIQTEAGGAVRTAIAPPAAPPAAPSAAPFPAGRDTTRILRDGTLSVAIEALTPAVQTALEGEGVADAALVPVVTVGTGAERLLLRVDGRPVAQAAFAVDAEGNPVVNARRLGQGPFPRDPAVAAVLLEHLFIHHLEATRLWLEPGALAALGVAEDGAGLVHGRSAHAAKGGKAFDVCLRAGLLQWAPLWHRPTPAAAFPRIPVPCVHGGTNPLRPPAPTGVVYERYDPQSDLTISFRKLDRKRDLDLFHDWMNQQRVAFFWELAKPRDELDAYLAALDADPHTYPLIGRFNGEDAGYYETYWGKEDRLGPHYDADDYDRGWHGAVGNKAHLGRRKTVACFKAINHYLFLDEPRTRKIVGEPRAEHVKMLAHAEPSGFVKIKEFDFPHKRAALVHCYRDHFFGTILK